MWLSTIVVARILAPADYGLVGMAMVYLGIATIIAEFGIGTAVVMLRDLPERSLAELNTVAALLGVAAWALSWLLAAPIAAFFEAPALRDVVIVMSATFVAAGLRVVPMALLQRELRFKNLALAEGAQALILAGTMVVLAMLGFGYWTLAIGSVLGGFIWTAGILALKRHPFAWPNLRELLPALTFSRQILFSRVTWYVYSSGDFFVAGKMLGQRALGAYTLAWTLASIPVDRLTALIVQVTPSFFSAVQTDRAAMRRYLLAITEGLSLITFPAAIGLALVADALVPTLLGSHWIDAVRPLQILGFYAAFRSIVPVLTPVLNATGNARFEMWVNVGMAILLPLGFVAGARWGTLGIAAAWLLIHPIATVPVYRRAFQAVETNASAYLRAIWPALSGVACMTILVLLLRFALGDTLPPVARLAVLVPAGAAIYAAAIWLFHRERALAFYRLTRTLRHGRTQPGEANVPDPLPAAH